VLGVAANDCAVHRRGVRIARSPLVDGEPDRRAGFVWNANEGQPPADRVRRHPRNENLPGGRRRFESGWPYGRWGSGPPRSSPNFGKMRRRRGNGP
jgi:hypothetical protein